MHFVYACVRDFYYCRDTELELAECHFSCIFHTCVLIFKSYEFPCDGFIVKSGVHYNINCDVLIIFSVIDEKIQPYI